MFDVFGTIHGLLKLDVVTIDNLTFRLHYKVSTVFLATFSVLVTSKQYFGDPIDCIVDGIEAETLDLYCWITSTFTIPSLTGAKVGTEVAHPGVANTVPLQGSMDGSIRYHKYYQWVTLFLFLQAMMFYIPRWLWKWWECGRVRDLVNQLNLPILTEEEKERRLNIAVEYFKRNLNYHHYYVSQFFACEILNFVNVVGQIFFTDRFLDFGFKNFGPLVVEHMQQGGPHDPMDEFFPKVGKCTFHTFGPSGTLRRHDALCVLPLNILNQKIFIFLWFWFVIVAVFSALGLIYRLATFSPTFRHLLLRGRSRLAASDKVESISQKCGLGDWFILYLVAKNMDPYIYKEFINLLSLKLVDKEHVS